ncbi:MAG: diacylglyceryl transferase [Proteobacteria bacterium]|nr:MAG: diacylglyceryl transferase [Pseudomonadota bacterium]
MKKLRERWGITSGFQLTIIFIVFAITGSTAAYLSKPILALFGITKDATSPWLYYPLYIILIFPVYQVLLVTIGFLFGQFRFFWAFEKKMLRGLGLGFLVRNKKNSRN